MAESTQRPPRDNLVRAFRQWAELPGVKLRSAEDGGMPTMTGHFAVFNEWARINSSWEGTFMEQFAPGSLTKTFQENRSRIRVTLNHGSDPQAGDKPLGPITELREDGRGGYFEVPLIDTSYNRDIVPGLDAGLYGMSMVFSVVKEDFKQRVSGSKGNPDGLPERIVQEARIHEFGPVTFPAYVGADVAVRSLTDDLFIRQLASDPDRLADLIKRYAVAALPEQEPSPLTPVVVEAAPVAVVAPVVINPRFHSREDFHRWLTSRI